MALNSSHAGKGVLLYQGEIIILYTDHVGFEFSGPVPNLMKGSKSGRLYLTTHRMIFNNKNDHDELKSFACPFFCLKKVELEQPVFGANYIKGFVRAQENGGFSGEVKFKMTFKHGGAIEYGQALLKVASMATRNIDQQWNDAPPPYTAPNAPWTNALPPAYAPPQAGYYGWTPPVATFPDRPPADSVFMYQAPPPYPGLNVDPNPQTNIGQQGAYGFQVSNGYDPKLTQGNQQGFYDTNNPQFAYVPPPPAYSPTAPNYEDKKQN